jgi:leader peptidase (prepilin peptidase)/N-methyltransferase
LSLFEAVIFSVITTILIGIAFVDFYTMQIPLALILIGIGCVLISIFKKSIYLSSAVYGIFVGAIIPLMIMGLLWLITKRQGMGFGDIQLGFVLGAWLGPMRMALTLFLASVLSLIVWIAVSLVHGFDKNRAIPMGPFLSVAGTGIYVGSFYYPELFHLLII